MNIYLPVDVTLEGVWEGFSDRIQDIKFEGPWHGDAFLAFAPQNVT